MTEEITRRLSAVGKRCRLRVASYKQAVREGMYKGDERCILVDDKPLLHDLNLVFEACYPFSSLKRMRELRRYGLRGQLIDCVKGYAIKDGRLLTHYYVKHNQLKVVWVEIGEDKFYLDRESLMRVAMYQYKDGQYFNYEKQPVINIVTIYARRLNAKEQLAFKKGKYSYHPNSLK